jgi:hypothetical protein
VQSVISRLTQLGSQNPETQIWACDIDPRALTETAKAASPHLPKLVLGNFLELEANDFQCLKFSAIVGNPPFLRLHAMDAQTRVIAKNSLPDPTLLNAKASLWAYFPIHAFKMLSKGGRMAWILPEAILHAEYGKQFVRWAMQRFERCIAISVRERCFLSDGAKARVVMLLLEGANGKASHEVEMIEVSTAEECVATLPRLERPSKALPVLNGHAVPHLISSFASTAAQIIESSDELKRLGDFADVKIGVVTGNNKFFVLSEEQRCQAKLNEHHFQRVVSKFIDLGGGFEFTGVEDKCSSCLRSERSWLLCPNPKSVDKRLAEYLYTYTQKKIDQNKTMAKREHWQTPELGQVPDAFFRYMGKQGPRIVLNQSGFYCTNTIHRVFFTKRLSKCEQVALCLSLHSSYSQLSAEIEGRQYGSGVLKLEPSEAKRVLFAFTEPLINALWQAWPALKRQAATQGWELIVSHIDDLVAASCPLLSKALPIQDVRALLVKVQQRRKG